ncbi:MAG: hypothetical protein Q9163_000230 [Psora crenata]
MSLHIARRLVVGIGTLALLTAVTLNPFIFLGINRGDIKSHIGDLKDIGPQLADVLILGPPKKPWHAAEEVDTPLDPVDNHPIATLMQEADTAFRKYEDERSKSFRETVRTYRRSHGRHPPPGFKEWYKYARKKNVHNIDDFQQIMDDIRPFWAVEPKVLRNLAANMWKNKDHGISGIHIRNHKIVKENNEGWRSNSLVSLINKFVKYLPDMDIAMNRHDQPRVVVPWEDLQALLEKEGESRRTPPETVDEFTTGMEGLLNIAAEDDAGEKEDPGWYPAHGKQYMDIVKTGCPPESSAGTNGTTLAEAESIYKDRLGGLIANFNLSTDLCTVGPQLASKHGLLFASSTMIPTKRLVPIFGECKVSVNNDILFPANMYWMNDERYKYDGKFDVSWEDKKDIMLWRGVTSGGAQNAENWRNMHRQRLLMQVNSTEMAGKEVRILTEQPEKKGEYENYREFHPSSFAAQHTDVGFTATRDCVPDCSFYEDVWTLKPEMTLGEQLKNKFLVDVDGHSFSGRWHAFLESRALGIKATIFREWHDSRLFAWRHFVPMDNRYDDIYTLLTYFIGVGTPPGRRISAPLSENEKTYVARHDKEGKRIADQGREWAKKVLRKADIEARYIKRPVRQLDTIDLQDPEAPSAKDHTRQPVRLGGLGDGAPAPHQADALKHVELEISEQHGRSPRHSQDLSGKELQLLHDETDSYGDHDPNDNILRNAVQHVGHDEAESGEEDDGLEDDMADKISSSPSIGDDGGYTIPQLPWPSQFSPLCSNIIPEKKATQSPGPPIDEFSSSPFTEIPKHFPLSFASEYQEDRLSKDHHHHHEEGGYTRGSGVRTSPNESEFEGHDQLSPLVSEQTVGYTEDESEEAQGRYQGGRFDQDDFHHLLLPDNDPLLNNVFDSAPMEDEHPSDTSSQASKATYLENLTEDPNNTTAAAADDDDDTEDISYPNDSRFVDSGWGGECLREAEDIDFEFVYALHTFVATVEGQANATKGDTMVLLDDSNSYWWLVRVVKDGSIGYLPAEHIETPLERLARLNKHRNLDLSQTMLGDQDEDKRANPLNPLRKAMRRRNVKKVEFSGNSYVEPSDVEYSSDEDEEGNDSFIGEEQNRLEEQRQDQRTQDADANASVAPVNSRDRSTNESRTEDEAAGVEIRSGNYQPDATEQTRNSDETLERNDDGTANKSRKGTLRNTDSFFKDDSVETRKINLTPSLLRDDSNGARPSTSESTELKMRASLESLEKDNPPEKTKDEKKKKEKRGMLGGMFKRKEKKSKGQDKDEDGEKASIESPRSPTPKESIEFFPQDKQAASAASQPHRQTSKLQKQPPAKLSPKSSSATQNQGTAQRQAPAEMKNPAASEPEFMATSTSDPSSSVRLVSQESGSAFDNRPSVSQYKTSDPAKEDDVTPQSPDKGANVFSPLVNALRRAPSESQPVKTKRSKERMRMDDFDSSSSSSSEERGTESPSRPESLEEAERGTLSHAAQAAQNYQHSNYKRSQHSSSRESLSDSPVQVTLQAQQTQQERNTPHHPPPLITNTSSPSLRDSSPSPASPMSPASSPGIIETPDNPATATHHSSTANSTRFPLEETPSGSPATQASPSTPSTTQTSPPWSDASLRAYLEDDSEIRDLLIVVNDKTGVKPRKDHPVIQGLFKEENQKLGEIERRLDGLLGEFLGRRRRRVGAR